MYCIKCGVSIPDNSKFCPKCGADLSDLKEAALDSQTTPVLQTSPVSQVDLTDDGGSSAIEIRFKDLWSEVFKQHSAREQRGLFRVGLDDRELSAREMVAVWPKPWLYSRVFLLLVFIFVCLMVIYHVFGNRIILPGLMFLGSVVIPFSMVTFFWETNIPRNIPLLEVLVMFLVGGAASIIPTMMGYTIFGHADMSLPGAILIGTIEEAGKALIIILILHTKNYKYILNGILVGACVGAGFAAFESAGYAFNFGLKTPRMMEALIYLRGFTSVGSHIIWSAMVGAGYMLAKSAYRYQKFLKYLLIAIALHAAWDWQVVFPPWNVKDGLLTIYAWYLILNLLHAGLRQIERMGNL